MDILTNERLLSWLLGGILIFAFTIPYLLRWRRNQREGQSKLDEAVKLGTNKPMMQHPIIDLSSCIGCGICTKVCPEGDILGLVGGKAVLINGRKCVGHEVCKESCPVGAIEVALGDVSSREDIPQLNSELESNLENVFIVGELGGLALIRNAVNQGIRVAETISQRQATAPSEHPVTIIGAGPAGLSTAISLQQKGLNVRLLDQSEPGGTILQYPRRKLVMVQPVDLPGYGLMENQEYSKEELLEIWDGILKEHHPEFESGHQLTSLEKKDGVYQITTSKAKFVADHVVLALGRRGTPRKLGVPGEELSKVAYQLIDAESFQGQHLLVVGGGDSAIEAAVGLGQQVGNQVTLSYRKSAFTRIKSRNEEQIQKAQKNGWVKVLFDSQVKEIKEEAVILTQSDTEIQLENQHVFIFAGGVPPFGLMETIGVKFGTATIS